MSVQKMINRIVQQNSGADKVSINNTYTRSIASDSLTKFAVVYAALIHDVDHQGVTNSVLVAEKSPVAAMYENKSVAEQNSITVALEFLGRLEFRELREAIAPNDADWRHFQDMVKSAVLTTDVFDKDLVAARNEKWDQVFHQQQPVNGDDSLTPYRDHLKASIVMEHLIQASDVSHTMQHWHVYRKWNECLFREQVSAFSDGRGDADPAMNWYDGEIGFFDHYIIPLAKKLKDCGVFGVSSDEYLNYALKNRTEWEAKGKEIVAEMVAELNK